MRTNDPAILKLIEQLEHVAESLRRIGPFPPLNETPETTSSRQKHWCDACNIGFTAHHDLLHHRAQDHAGGSDPYDVSSQPGGNPHVFR